MKPSFDCEGGEGKDSDPELMLLVEEDLDSGPRRESFKEFALNPRPTPPVNQSS